MRRGFGGFWTRPFVWGSFVSLLLSCLFAISVLALVIGPVRESRRALVAFERRAGCFVAEDLMLRALETPGFLARGSVSLPEGGLSSRPGREAEVELRWGRRGTTLMAYVTRDFGTLSFEGTYSFGELAAPWLLALGQGRPSLQWDPAGIEIQGRQARLAPREGEPASLLERLGPRGSFDLVVRAEEYFRDPEPGWLGNRFRRTETLPQRWLGRATDLDDFELRGCGPDPDIVILESKDGDGMTVKVEGNLWLGRPGETMRLSTGGSTLVLLVTGNLYVCGDLRLAGDHDMLFVCVGKPGGAAVPFVDDHDGAGGHQLLGHTFPREGRGAIHLGLGDLPPPEVEAMLLAENDVLVGRNGAGVRGVILCGGGLHRLGGDRAGPFRLLAASRSRDLGRPVRGLPMEPGSEHRPRVTSIRPDGRIRRHVKDEVPVSGSPGPGSRP